MPVYDLDDPESKASLDAQIIRRTPEAARLAFALSLATKADRIAYIRQIRSRHGEAAAQQVIAGLKGVVR